MLPWPWQRAAKDRTPREVREGLVRIRFRDTPDPKALHRATRAGLRAASRALPGKGTVRATGDLVDGREAVVTLTLTGERVTDDVVAPVEEAFTRAFRVSYRGVFAQRELPERVPTPAPPGDVSTP